MLLFVFLFVFFFSDLLVSLALQEKAIQKAAHGKTKNQNRKNKLKIARSPDAKVLVSEFFGFLNRGLGI